MHKVISNIVSTATSMKEYQLGLEIGARLAKTAKDTMENRGEAILELIDSAKILENSLEPHLGSVIDVRV